jgi:hypothetical protein
MADSVSRYNVKISNEIWKELEAASTVEAPLLIKPYFNEIIKNEDKNDFKRPMELMVEEYGSLSPKQNWIFR